MFGSIITTFSLLAFDEFQYKFLLVVRFTDFNTRLAFKISDVVEDTNTFFLLFNYRSTIKFCLLKTKFATVN